MKNKVLFTLLTATAIQASGQCDTNYITTNYTQSSDIIMSGVYYVDGDFTLPSGITIYVESFEFGGCGVLEIHADNITIDGTINGDYAGYVGGTGGAGASAISSITGHLNGLTSCDNKDDAGRVEVEGGHSGAVGAGSGGGNGAAQGGQGSGPKQQCQSSGDDAGMIGGSGGAGGGAGGSYGGAGSAGSSGGAGTDNYTLSTGSVSISPAYAVVGGNGGNGGTPGSPYGTATGFDIDLGSGGAGAGGGGRSYDSGLVGGAGGAGGGMVKLIGINSLTLSGIITVNGANGLAGGSGGSGGVTSKCCSDGCDDCGEATVSCGAGGGGGAGGGSGGGIYLETAGMLDFTGDVYAEGGNGGPGGGKGYGSGCTYNAGVFCGDDQTITSMDGDDGGQGGAGGGGRVKLFYRTCEGSTINPGITSVAVGTGNGIAEAGTYEEICDYASVDQLMSKETIQIYPNPAESIIHFVVPNNVAIHQVLIVNALGEVVWKNGEMNSIDAIEVASLKAGIYFIQFSSDFQTVSLPFIKK